MIKLSHHDDILDVIDKLNEELKIFGLVLKYIENKEEDGFANYRIEEL